MSNIRKLMFSLVAALLLVLAACNTAPEAIKEPDTAKAMDNCDKFLDRSTGFPENFFVYTTDAEGRPSEGEGILGGPAERVIPGPRDAGCQSRVGNWFEGPNTHPDYQGGHLIAAQLGGWGRRANLVPQVGNFNDGVWKQVEGAAAECADDDDILMRVNVRYPSTTTIVPDYMKITFEDFNDLSNSIDREFENDTGGGPNGQAYADELITWLTGNGC